jgi:hypothetical protein
MNTDFVVGVMATVVTSGGRGKFRFLVVILSEAKKLSWIYAGTERFYASLRMTKSAWAVWEMPGIRLGSAEDFAGDHQALNFARSFADGAEF